MLEIVEFPLANLLANNVDIPRKEHLLCGLDCESWQEAYNDGKRQEGPERQLAVHLRRGAVECESQGSRRVDTCPEPNKQDADGVDENCQPVPAISIEEDVKVGDHDGGGGGVHADAFAIIDVAAIFGVERGWCEQEIRHEPYHNRLVQSVEHVKPKLRLRPFFSLDASCVKLRDSQRYFVINILIENAHKEDRQ